MVVVSIIAILASMLLPALNQARDKARTGLCMSNQKQLGVASHLYMDDYDQAMIVREDAAAGDPNPYSDSQRRWFEVISAELGTDAYQFTTMASRAASADADGDGIADEVVAFNREFPTLWCPADPSQQWLYSHHPTSYAVPGTVVIVYRTEYPGAANCSGDALSVRAKGHDFKRVSEPDAICFLGEGGHSSWYHVFAALSEVNMALEVPGHSTAAYDHAYGLNYLFFDGHVRWGRDTPHDFDYRVISGVYRSGLSWSSAGTQGFRDQFHDGACP